MPVGAPRGNKNASGKRRAKYKRKAVSFSGPTLELIYEYLASQGNVSPTDGDVTDAIYYAVRTIYGRRLEDDRAIIL